MPESQAPETASENTEGVSGARRGRAAVDLDQTSAAVLEEAIKDRMPERTLLEILARTALLAGLVATLRAGVRG